MSRLERGAIDRLRAAVQRGQRVDDVTQSRERAIDVTRLAELRRNNSVTTKTTRYNNM